MYATMTSRLRAPDAAEPFFSGRTNSPGRSLDPPVRKFFETRFNHDFSKVKIHDDVSAATSAHDLNALAYTTGQDIYFSRRFSPNSADDQRLLAHELVHVQQDGTQVSDTIRLSGVPNSVEREADSLSASVLREPLGTFVKPTRFSGSNEILRQVNMTVQPNKSIGDQGHIFSRRFAADYVRLGPAEAIQSLDIELAFVRKASSQYADPGNLNWFQTFRTNFPASSNEVPPQDTTVYDFCDGQSIPPFGDQNPWLWVAQNASTFQDHTHRRSLADRNVLWKAETSAVGLSPAGPKILETKEWGFEMTRLGESKVTPVSPVSEPSSYHKNKFEELRAK
jgi:hypothetical protein